MYTAMAIGSSKSLLPATTLRPITTLWSVHTVRKLKVLKGVTTGRGRTPRRATRKDEKRSGEVKKNGSFMVFYFQTIEQRRVRRRGKAPTNPNNQPTMLRGASRSSSSRTAAADAPQPSTSNWPAHAVG